MTLKASFIAVRYYTNTDPYHYTIDNRPLTDLKTCLDFLADTIDAGFTTALLTTTAISTGSTTSLTVSTSGGTQLRIAHVASAVNFVTVNGNVTGNTPTIKVTDSGDANIGLTFGSKGTGAFDFKTDFVGVNSNQFRVSHTASAVNAFQVTGGATGNFPQLLVTGADANVSAFYTTRGTGGHRFTTNSDTANEQVRIRHTPNAVNYWDLSGAATAGSPIMRTQGSDANVAATFVTLGTGGYHFYTQDTAALQLQILNTTGSNRNIILTGSNGGNPTIATSAGNLAITPTLVFTTDNTADIGTTAANRPRSGYFAGRLLDGQITVTYSASMTLDAALGNDYVISATNATAFTINAPTNPLTGQFISILIRNTSGGALGVATWNAVFKMTAWVQPANANSRCIYFAYDGTNWVERGRTTVDVPN